MYVLLLKNSCNIFIVDDWDNEKYLPRTVYKFGPEDAPDIEGRP